MDTAIIIAIIGAIPGLIALISQFRKTLIEERRVDAEIAEKIATAAGDLVDDLRKQIDTLKEDVACLTAKVSAQDAEICRMKRGVNKLVAQIRKLGEEPCWIPDMESSEII